jgi:hypothetical protein
MYTLLIEYPLRKFITTKVIANNEYEEDQLAKGDAYLHKLMQVVPEYVKSGRIVGSAFNAEGTQIIVRGEVTVPAASEEEARTYLDRYAADIPDYSLLRVLEIKKTR